MRHALLSLIVLLPCSTPSFAQYGPGFTSQRQHDGTLFFEQFGKAVSGGSDFDGDGTPDYLVGSNQSDNGILDAAGAVFVYSGRTGVLIRTFYGTQTSQLFGEQVADLGDINGDGIGDLAVTSAFGSPNYVNVGIVQVLSGADGSELYFFDASGDFSGMGIAIDGPGDVNADGVPDILIGESRANPLGTGSIGVAYVYSGWDGSLLHEFHGPSSGSAFGAAVGGAGDVNGDGHVDLIISAMNTPSPFYTFVGTAYVYSGLDGSLLHTWSGTTFQENFGSGVDGVGDIDGDGYSDVAVGAVGNDVASPNAGAVFVYSGLTGLPVLTMQGVFQDFMGRYVDGPGDCNGDGIPDILVGSFGPGAANNWAGRAWLFSGFDGSQLLQTNGAADGEYMGAGISGIGDTNGDGAAEVLIGASRVSHGGLTFVGSAFLYGLDPHLHVNTDRLSDAAGSVLSLSIELPAAAAGYTYRTLMSVRGRGPTSYSIDIPLTYDRFVGDSYGNVYPFSLHTGLHGVLDINGDATASITFPAGAYSFAIGRTFYLATIAHPLGWPPEYTTGSVAITMTP